jgi:hypothetical protein
MRVFIMYDEDGEILSVSQVEAMPEGVEHPFHLDNPKHSVVELEPDDEIVKKLHADNSPEQKVALDLHGNYRFDTKSKRLRKVADMAKPDKTAEPQKAPKKGSAG